MEQWERGNGRGHSNKRPRARQEVGTDFGKRMVQRGTEYSQAASILMVGMATLEGDGNRGEDKIVRR